MQAELLLVDSATQGNQSLGRQPVPAPLLRFDGVTPPPVDSRLAFPISPGRLLRFDQISVRFHLSHPRATHSARVAIRQFTLQP